MQTPEIFPPADPDSTIELASADRTMTDLPPVYGDPIGAREPNGTQEIDGADILEVQRVAKFELDVDVELEEEAVIIAPDPIVVHKPTSARDPNLSDVFGALKPRKPAPLPSLPSLPQIPRPALMPSIAPFAIDVQPPSTRDPLLSTVEIVRAAGLPNRKRAVLVAAGVIAACASLGIAAIVATLAGGSPKVTAASESIANDTFIELSYVGTETGSIEERAPDDDPLPPPIIQSAPAPAPSTPRAVVRFNSSPPAAVASPMIKAAPMTKASPVRTGVLRFPASVNGLLVDGAPRRVSGGSAVLTCGKHKIKLPAQPARKVDLPCGGSVAL